MKLHNEFKTFIWVLEMSIVVLEVSILHQGGHNPGRVTLKSLPKAYKIKMQTSENDMQISNTNKGTATCVQSSVQIKVVMTSKIIG